MRHIEFAQPFAQHLGKVIVIADMRQEFAISGTHGIPVYPMHIEIVETLLMLFIDMIEHIFAFCCQVHRHIRLIAYGLQCFGVGIHLLHGTSAQDKDFFSFLIHFHVCPTGIHLMEQLGILLSEV